MSCRIVGVGSGKKGSVEVLLELEESLSDKGSGALLVGSSGLVAREATELACAFCWFS